MSAAVFFGCGTALGFLAFDSNMAAPRGGPSPTAPSFKSGPAGGHGKGLPRALIQSKQAEEVIHGSDLITEMLALSIRTEKILTEAERSRDLKIALIAIAEIRRNKELLARLQGELENQPTKVTANLNAQKLDLIELLPGPLIAWFARNRRLPRAEDCRQLLPADDPTKADKSSGRE